MPGKPEFSFNQVFSSEQFAGPEKAKVETIGVRQIDELVQFLDEEMVGFGNSDWKTIHRGSVKKYKEIAGDYDSPLEQAVLVSKLLSAHIIDDESERDALNSQYLDLADQAQYETTKEGDLHDIKAEIDKRNIFSAAYQNEVAKMILALRSVPGGKEHLAKFWEDFKALSDKCMGENQKFSEGYRRGIEGFVAVHDIFQNLGYETFFAFPEQDALDKIDLWIKKGEKVIALQIKTHRKGNIKIRAERVREQKNTQGMPPWQAKEINQRNTFLNMCSRYTKNWGREVVPLWVDLDGINGFEMKQDQEGYVIIPSNFDVSGFAHELEEEING